MSRWSGLAMLSLKRSLRVAASGGGYGFSSPSPWASVVRGQYWNSNSKWFLFNRHLCVGVNPPKGEKEQAHKQEEEVPISMTEAKKLMRLVNVESLKRKLDMEGREVIGYSDLIESCKSMGVAKSVDEATAFVELLDQAGVILLFRDKVYLHPDKVVDMVRRAVPLALAPEDDPRRDELNALQMKKQEIDRLAHRQVRNILWAGLGFSVLQVGLFFRLTFWEFSWDVMEPIAFFTTTTGLVVGYAYFLFTSRDPSYQDLMKRLYLSRQRKLIKKQNFDIDRFVELQRHCKSPLEHRTSSKSAKGDDNDIDDHALHSDRSTTPRSL